MGPLGHCTAPACHDLWVAEMPNGHRLCEPHRAALAAASSSRSRPRGVEGAATWVARTAGVHGSTAPRPHPVGSSHPHLSTSPGSPAVDARADAPSAASAGDLRGVGHQAA